MPGRPSGAAGGAGGGAGGGGGPGDDPAEDPGVADRAFLPAFVRFVLAMSNVNLFFQTSRKVMLCFATM